MWGHWKTRNIDGTDNNRQDSTLGGVDSQLLRIASVEYADGISEPAGADRPSAREISNAVAAQTTTETNERGLTDITWLWGQFIDHDIDLTENADPAEPFNIEVPAGDFYFDPGRERRRRDHAESLRLRSRKRNIR